jgi:sucrose-6-phosphate hydrolase SacC (GH32 family)
MSVPREFKLENGKITAYPVEEVRHLLKDSDEALIRTENGFTVERSGRAPLVYEGKIDELKILRDGYVMEIFVNGGQEVYTVIL